MMRKFQNKRNKVIVIGLDGGTFDILNPMMEEGIMPNLAKLIKEGAYGEMDTYLTGVGQGWASFMTGKDPTKHGVFYWSLGKFDSTYFEGKTVWDIIGSYGKKVGIINVPYTYPPQLVNGFMISGLGGGLLPSKKVVFTYPKHLYDEIVSEIGNYDRGWLTLYDKSPKQFLKDIIRVTRLRTQAASYLLNKFDCDFFMIVFRGMDSIQHNLWNYLDSTNPLSKDDTELSKLIVDYYRLVDDFVGRVACKDEQTYTFVISDHGFGPSKAIFQINELLARKGYLVKNRKMRSRAVNSCIRKMKLHFGSYYKKMLMNERMYNVNKIKNRRLSSRILSVDWSKTVAFAESEFGISINLKGRNPLGIVNPGKDYEMLREEIIAGLTGDIYPDSGEKIFNKIYRKEALDLKKSFEIAPDILFECAECFQADVGIDISSANPPVFRSLKTERFKHGTGIHRRHGMFIANGINVKKNYDVEGTRIIDIAPTILDLMGIPVPHDMDGHVLQEIIEHR